MIFSRLQDDRLHISLTRAETIALFGTADKIEGNSSQTKNALRLLIRRAMCDRLIQPDLLSVGVEIMRNLSGGYDIYLSKGKAQSPLSRKARAVLEFSQLRDLIRTSRILNPTTRDESNLYRIDKLYRLIINTGDSSLPLCEFADRVSFSPILIAVTEEYGRKIIGKNAIETLAKL